ncbi:hypothetical protein [Paraburkholderia youngii]|uniref:Uncharacterized protein n=1 Tax=Paraburkholderia youngii TaxID=2782701 RepID=A0A7W8P569_9BURK|nr:hypothetical protein [Paraburkholderia youngii]MBB5405149.1 hypothetical protein [Paraburkholderia youngii]
MRSTVGHNIYDVVLFQTQRAAQRVAITTPGTRISWSSLEEWMVGWKHISARAATSKRHAQRAAHVAALASHMELVNRETDIETLAAVKLLVEREKMLPPRGEREGHPATEILQRVGTVLNERRRVAIEPDVGARRTDWKAAA